MDYKEQARLFRRYLAGKTTDADVQRLQQWHDVHRHTEASAWNGCCFCCCRACDPEDYG